MTPKSTRLLVSRLFLGSCIFCIATLTYLNLSVPLHSDCGNDNGNDNDNGNEIDLPPEIPTATAIKWNSSSSLSATDQSLVKPVAEQSRKAEAEAAAAAATASTVLRKTFYETGSQTKPSHEESEKAAPTAHLREETPQKKELQAQAQAQAQEQKRSKRAKFWRYDSFGPTIEHARTHFLSSIPPKHRMILSPEERDALSNNPAAGDAEFFDLLRDRYSFRPENLWPNKIHLAEMNPCIARLPERYRNNELWRSLFDGTAGTTSMPQYVSVYRVTHLNNCYDGTTFANFFGGSWDIPLRTVKKTDYLGVSLMDADLNVVLDTTVNLGPIAFDPKKLLNKKRKKPKPFSIPIYDDFRLFNLGNDAQNEQLYLTSTMYISPIELDLVSSAYPSSEHHTIPDSFVEIPPAFGDKRDTGDIINSNSNSNSNHRNGTLALKVWVRNYTSCPVGSHDGTVVRGKRAPNINKNLLYFGADAHRTARVLMYPRQNPNDVSHVDLDESCDSRMRPDDIAEAARQMKIAGPNQAIPSFKTIEARKYPRSERLFLGDRGSACCVRVKRSLIRETLRPVNDDEDDGNVNFNNNDNNNNNSGGDDDQELLVAVVHPKTKFPGKRLPKDVIPNTYLSRFIAFLPEEPYTIVAKTGMFCLGYPERGMDDLHHDGGENPSDANPLTFRKMVRLSISETIHNCPRIHFVMGMTEKVKQDPSEEDAVLISYGVSDCLSRFVEIKTSEIVRMFAGSSA